MVSGETQVHFRMEWTLGLERYTTPPLNTMYVFVLVDGAMREKMQGILARIQNGSFAEAWMQEHRGGKVEMLRRRHEESNILQERVGRELRSELLERNS